jgi:hypothetical protein
MKNRSIEIVIGPSGQLEIEAVGFKGSDCEKATAFLEKALGQITATHRKPEWHQRAIRQTQQRLGHEC